jgi:hypothetical protein
MAPDLSKIRPLLLDDMVRLGRDNDGGYVVSARSLRDCNVLIGLGINTDWSFEEAVLARHPGMALIGVDGTVSPRRLLNLAAWQKLKAVALGTQGRLGEATDAWRSSQWYLQTRRAFRDFFERPRRVFLEKMILDADCISDSGICWADVVRCARSFEPEDSSRWFVKMDIEGAEYRVLPELLESAEHIDGMAVEFHDCDLMARHVDSLLERLSEHLVVVHVHGNNNAPLIRGSTCPRLLEVSFVNRRLLDANEMTRPNDRRYPTELDQPNRADKADYELYA